jgi:large subunit ribosomal protein L18e
MGIDIQRKRVRSRTLRESTTPNNYMQLLQKLYGFLARRTDSEFNKLVFKRLNMSRINRFPISLSKLVKLANNEEKQKKILVITGNVLDDERMLTLPKLRVCALKFSEQARTRIVKAGGECLTFDQLAKIAPLGQGTWLVRGAKKREAYKHFRGLRGDNAKPYIVNNNHKARERNYSHIKK